MVTVSWQREGAAAENEQDYDWQGESFTADDGEALSC